MLCATSRQARQLSGRLEQRLREALHDFRREKLNRQTARLSVAACLYDDYSNAIPKRKLLLAPGVNNYKYVFIPLPSVSSLSFFYLLCHRPVSNGFFTFALTASFAHSAPGSFRVAGIEKVSRNRSLVAQPARARPTSRAVQQRDSTITK